MGINGYTGQLVGPFKSKEELFTKIRNNSNNDIEYIQHLGIQTDIGNIVYINKKPYEIGKTGIYEVGNTEITSLYFNTNVDENTIVDYIVYIAER